MSLSSSFYSKVEQQVAIILSEYGVEHGPVSVIDIAMSKGAYVVPYELGDEISGVLVVEENKGTIGYNMAHHKKRQRFTIAHELGHFILHVNKNKPNEMFVDKDFIIKWRYEKAYSPTEFKQEQEANAFAAALLMPREFLLKEMSKDKYVGYTETDLIDALAKVFEVSSPAMTYRFSDLNRLGVI